MNETTGVKQQIIEKIKGSSNILVTVGRDPSVDALSAALGMTILLNKLDKHATAVVSGAIPPAISFLEPEKTFEGTVDSLRDFIIALDKEKADHLRYKLEGDVVKIFITPYRTTITQDDLDFSQGDYNVELVLALGVQDKDHLDAALEAHGRILHDATTVAISSGQDKSDLGDVNWHESNASSISEMLTSLSEALRGDKALVDEQVATAFLTGIVATTDRFSNNKTSSKVMTIAAQLMAAGANQQLIAAKLTEGRAIEEREPEAPANEEKDLTEDKSEKIDKSDDEDEGQKPDGSLAISHEPEGDLDEVAEEVATKRQQQATEEAEDELAKQLGDVAPVAAPQPSVESLDEELAKEAGKKDVNRMPHERVIEPLPGQEDGPLLGGTLNATAEQAADDKRREELSSRNHTLLTHGDDSQSDPSMPSFIETPFSATLTTPNTSISTPLFDTAPAGGTPSTATEVPAPAAEPSQEPTAKAEPESQPAPQAEPLPSVSTVPPGETLADIDAKNRGNTGGHADALADVHAAFDDASPVSTLPPQVPEAAPEQPAMPPLPPSEFSTLPPLPLPPQPPTFDAGLPPAEPLGQMFEPPAAPPSEPQSTDPNQFKIPGQ